MKRWTRLTLAVVAAAGFTVGCAGDAGRDARTDDSPSAVGTSGADMDAGTDRTRVDLDFVRDQIEDGEGEVMLGRLAAEKARDPQVKDFAQMMVRDHQKAGEELRQAAGPAVSRDENANEPRENEHKDVHERLSKLSGAEFDREYMDVMVKEHEEAVNELEGKAQNSEHPQIQQWASKTLQHVQHHLERARQIQETLERAGNGNR